MESENPAQLPVVQETEAQPPSGQPIIYQMAPGQQQPVFIQVPNGQPATTSEGQPIQYYYVPVGQPAQPGQSGQPVFVQGAPGQPAQTGQPVFIQGAPGQPGQSGQPVFIQGAPGQPVQPQKQAGQGGFELNINTEFLKSPPCFIKIAEFVTLLGAWASILKYEDMFEGLEDKKADFFKGIMIFSWVVVILYLIIYALSVPKMCNCKRPSLFTITSVVFYFVLLTLLLACTGNLVPRAVDLGEYFKLPPSTYKDKVMPYIIALDVALAFGFISCILFVVDMVLNYRLFQTQRAQEIPSYQGPPQRRVWDINLEYLKSPVFYVKLVEMALLFGAWVCILKYFDLDVIKKAEASPQPSLDLSKEEFFRGITIFSWVMVIFLALTFIFSLDKICNRSSPWTLTTLFVYFFLSIMLIACCGNLTPLAIDFGKIYKNVHPDKKPNVLALFIGLGFGYIAWIVFIVDISLIYKMYRQQRRQEFPPDQAGHPVIQQPGVVIMPQNLAQGGKQQVFQPLAHPGQQPVQQPVVIGMPPPDYGRQPQQDPTQK